MEILVNFFDNLLINFVLKSKWRKTKKQDKNDIGRKVKLTSLRVLNIVANWINLFSKDESEDGLRRFWRGDWKIMH